MSPEDVRKQKKRPQAKSGWQETLEGVFERLREGMEELAKGLNPTQPQPIPIPIPAERRRRR